MSEEATAGAFVLRTTFGATPERVFRLMTDPAALVQWWGPDGFSTPEAVVDARVGGGYRLTMQPPDGPPFHLAGAFLEVDPPYRLGYTFRWEEPVPDDRETVVLLVLRPVAAGTDVVLSHGGFATDERLELHRAGWTQALGKLGALLEGAASGVDDP
jgi:uncharacterized protein YndB with AHSA1/START domain